MALLPEVTRYIQRHSLLSRCSGVVVGTSGGPDSVTLLHLLRRVVGDSGLRLHVAHLNHSIRGSDADGDAAFVEALADRWDLPVTCERLDVPSLAAREGIALEEAARRARYGFLGRVAQATGASHIAVGHNADDQAETVLMHTLRGAGPAGLRGMLPKRGYRDFRHLLSPPSDAADIVVIRPLLRTPRSDIEAYLEQHTLTPRFDRSNLDTAHFRNRLRHEVLPYLRQINPRISERLQNLAEVVRADYELLSEFVNVAHDTLLVHSHSDAKVYDLGRWREQPLAVRRALVRRAAHGLCQTLRDVSFDHVEQAVDVAQRGGTGARATLPHDLALTVGYTTLTISTAGALHLPIERPWLTAGAAHEITVPGMTTLPNGWVLQTKELAYWDMQEIRTNPNPLVAWVDAAVLHSASSLRTRKTGDRFQPQGMRGSTVQLSDFLINRKVPQQWRDRIPLLVVNNRILWVAGHRLSEAARVRSDTARVVYIRLVKPRPC